MKTLSWQLLLSGEEGTTELADEVAELLTDKFNDLEVEIVQGDQPVSPLHDVGGIIQIS